MSKRVREKCGKLCIFSIRSSKRGITPTKIDGNWRQYSKTKSNAKFQLEMSKHEGEKCGKLHICNSLKLKRA